MFFRHFNQSHSARKVTQHLEYVSLNLCLFVLSVSTSYTIGNYCRIFLSFKEKNIFRLFRFPIIVLKNWVPCRNNALKLKKRLKLWKDQPSTTVLFVGNKAKGRIAKRCFKKTKHTIFSEKRTFLRTFTYQGVRNVRFFGKFDVLCFLETPVLRFAFLPYYQRIMVASDIYKNAHL